MRGGAVSSVLFCVVVVVVFWYHTPRSMQFVNPIISYHVDQSVRHGPFEWAIEYQLLRTLKLY